LLQACRAVNDDGQQERLIVGHVARPLYRDAPLAAEVSLGSGIGVRRNQRDEQDALVDLLGDLAIPGVATAQLALVEPNLDAGRSKRRGNMLRSLGILRCVAKKDRFLRTGHGARLASWK
jgi:hypothetical protein